MNHVPDSDMIALGIQQPWADLIVRGIKTIEVRSQNTNVRGTIYVYASRKLANHSAASEAISRHRLDVESLPRGLIVGTVSIESSVPAVAKHAAAACVPCGMLTGCFSWQLANPCVFEEPLPVHFLPYGVWFYPWKRQRSTRQRRRPD